MIGVAEIGCMAHTRRKLFDLHVANKGELVEYALKQIGLLYEIERQAQPLEPDQRQSIQQEKPRPILDAFHQWMALQRQKMLNGSAIARAIDYSLKRWVALTRYYDDATVPIEVKCLLNQVTY